MTPSELQAQQKAAIRYQQWSNLTPFSATTRQAWRWLAETASAASQTIDIALPLEDHDIPGLWPTWDDTQTLEEIAP